MWSIFSRKITVLGILWLILLGFLGFSLVFVANYPKNNPDKTLEIEQKVISYFNRITLPIKIAKLSALEPDKEIRMPVFGHRVSEIADTWASPRSEGRTHEGQDIFASRGTPIFSATEGYVTRIRQNTLGGNTINIVGAGGARYYYAHLDRYAKGLEVGDKVTTDTVIGFVGNTGNAESTPSHLHFGMYISRQAVNPLPLMINR